MKLTKTILSTIVLGSMLIAGSVKADDIYLENNIYIQKVHYKTYASIKSQADAYANLADVLTELVQDDYPNYILTLSEKSNGWLFPDTYSNLQQIKFWNHHYMVALADFNDVRPTEAAFKTMEKPMSSIGWSTKGKLEFVKESLTTLKEREEEYKNIYEKCTRYISNDIQAFCPFD